MRATLGTSCAALILVIAGCFASACTPETSPEASLDDNAVVSSSLLIDATGSGIEYRDQCQNFGVPIPPSFSTATVGPNGPWVEKGEYGDSYTLGTGNVSRVYANVQQAAQQTNKGLCVISATLGSGGSLFSVICQGNNGVACFWEDSVPSAAPPSTPLVIAGSSFKGGTALVAECTRCHAGGNAFIGHNTPSGHPLSQTNLTLPGWNPPKSPPTNPAQSIWYDPIVLPKWDHNPGPSSTGYPSQCTGCHSATGSAGAFPTLGRKSFDIRNASDTSFCSILENVTDRPASLGGMPPTIGECTSGVNCARQTDPQVRAMLAACGRPTSMPSPSGMGPPYGIGTPISTRTHISPSAPGTHKHFFSNTTTTMPNAGCCTNQNAHPSLATDDTINVYVYLTKDDMPRELMLQFFDGATWFNAFWSATASDDLITNVGARTRLGGLPQPDSWQVLAFRPIQFGMPAGKVLSAMAFTLFDGQAEWADTLFRNTANPYLSEYVSQVWLADWQPSGSFLVTENEGPDPGAWRWRENLLRRPSDLPFPSPEVSSSTETNTNGARRAKDGNTWGDYFSGSVFHSLNVTNSTSLGVGVGGEWWKADLKTIRTVRKVIIHNRTDCCADRLSHFRINWAGLDQVWHVASDQSNTIVTAANQTLQFAFSPVNARYIMIQKTDLNTYLHFAEVEILGDP